MTTYIAPVEDMMFLYENLRNNNNYNEIIEVIKFCKFHNLCSEIWLIDCDLDQQFERLMYRDQLNHQQAKCRINSQIPIAIKKNFADHIIDNSKEIDLFQEQINKLL